MIIVPYMRKFFLQLLLLSSSIAVLSSCASDGPVLDQFNKKSPPRATSSDPLAVNSTFWNGDAKTTWFRLQSIPLDKLQNMNTTDPIKTGWIKLAIISKRDSNSNSELTQDLQSWRGEYRGHPGNTLFPDNSSLSQLKNPAPHHIGIMLPLEGPLGKQGKTVRDGFLSAYNASLAKTHMTQTLSFYDTSQSYDVTSLYQKAIADGVDFIIGPLTKDHVQALRKQGDFSIPILALNYSDNTSNSLPTNFYEFGLSSQDETVQLADKARADGYSRAIIITTQNESGLRLSKSLAARWVSNGGKIQETLYVTPEMKMAMTIATLLHVTPSVGDNSKPASHDEHKNKHLDLDPRHDIDVVFLLTPPQESREIVPLIKYYYVNHLPIYGTSIVYSGVTTPRDADLDGVIFCDTPATLNGSNTSRLFAIGVDAYSLSNDLSRLTTLPNFPIYGSTGALTLDANHQIYRRLPWVTMHDGHV